VANFRLATDEDLNRLFGSGRLIVGAAIRPTSSNESSSLEEPRPNSEMSSDGVAQTNEDP